MSIGKETIANACVRVKQKLVFFMTGAKIPAEAGILLSFLWRGYSALTQSLGLGSSHRPTHLATPIASMIAPPPSTDEQCQRPIVSITQ